MSNLYIMFVFVYVCVVRPILIFHTAFLCIGIYLIQGQVHLLRSSITANRGTSYGGLSHYSFFFSLLYCLFLLVSLPSSFGSLLSWCSLILFFLLTSLSALSYSSSSHSFFLPLSSFSLPFSLLSSLHLTHTH